MKRPSAFRMVECLAAAACIAAFLPAFPASAAEAGGFRPERIVYSDAGVASKGMAKRLAQEFARAVSRTVGRECAFEREAQGGIRAPGTIYVGNTLAAKAAGLDAEALPALGYRLVVTNGAAYVLAKTTTAAAYGISGFAARFLDYHFITFDGDDPFTPAPGLALSDADITEIPEIYYRTVYAIDKYRKFPELKRDWPMRHLLFKTNLAEDEVDPAERLSRQTHSCHSQFDYVPPEIYFKDHPEYYSLGKDGNRHGVRNRRSHLCLTHPDVEQIVWSNLVSFIERDRREHPRDYPRIYDFSQMDAAPDFCRCGRCAETAAKYDAKGGRTDGGDAGIQLEFVNRIARRLKTAYPDVRLRIFAYVSTEVPPKEGTIRPEDNVIVWICDLYSTSDHEVPLTHPANAPRLKILRDWAKIASDIEIWDYMLYGDLPNLKGGHGDFPEVNVDAIAADARLFRDSGAKRLFMECEYRDQPFHELNIHAMGQLYFDPDADVEKIVGDYCRVYGAAAGKMREAIDLIRRLQLSSPANATENFRWHRRDLAWLTLENLERIRSLFKEAEALADTPGAKRRVAHALRSIENKLKLVRKSAVGEAEYLFTCNDFNRANLCKIIDDPVATGGKAIEILHRDAKDVKKPVKPELPLLMGVYNWETKGNSTFKFMPEESAEYRWYKLGEVELPPSPTIWLSKDWGFTIDLRSCYANGDGLPDDYNRFEIFASAKFTGGRLFFDQVRMVRIAAKKTSGKTTIAIP